MSYHKITFPCILLLVVFVACSPSSTGTPSFPGEKGDGLFPVCRDQKCGYIDNKGNIVIDLQFDWAYPFSDDGLAAIQMGRSIGFIDETGQVVISPQFESFGFWNFSEGLAAILINGMWGYINTEGQIVIAPQFWLAYPFHKGLAIVDKNGESGYIDNKGLFHKARIESIDLSRVGSVYPPIQPFTLLNAIYGPVEDPTGYQPSPFSGLVMVSFPGRLMSGCHGFFEGGLTAISVNALLGFSEGLAITANEEHNKYGYIDSSGLIAIEPVFSNARLFSEGLAAVEDENGRWGFIDKTGRFIIQPQFDDAGYFSEGLANVALENKWGFIDNMGNTVINPQFNLAEPFSDGIAVIANWDGDSRKLGLIDRTGKITVKPKYFDVCKMGNGVWQVWEEPTIFGYIDRNGEIIWRPTKVVLPPVYPEMSNE